MSDYLPIDTAAKRLASDSPSSPTSFVEIPIELQSLMVIGSKHKKYNWMLHQRIAKLNMCCKTLKIHGIYCRDVELDARIFEGDGRFKLTHFPFTKTVDVSFSNDIKNEDRFEWIREFDKRFPNAETLFIDCNNLHSTPTFLLANWTLPATLQNFSIRGNPYYDDPNHFNISKYMLNVILRCPNLTSLEVLNDTSHFETLLSNLPKLNWLRVDDPRLFPPSISKIDSEDDLIRYIEFWCNYTKKYTSLSSPFSLFVSDWNPNRLWNLCTKYFGRSTADILERYDLTPDLSTISCLGYSFPFESRMINTGFVDWWINHQAITPVRLYLYLHEFVYSNCWPVINIVIERVIKWLKTKIDDDKDSDCLSDWIMAACMPYAGWSQYTESIVFLHRRHLNDLSVYEGELPLGFLAIFPDVLDLLANEFGSFDVKPLIEHPNFIPFLYGLKDQAIPLFVEELTNEVIIRGAEYIPPNVVVSKTTAGLTKEGAISLMNWLRKDLFSKEFILALGMLFRSRFDLETIPDELEPMPMEWNPIDLELVCVEKNH